MQLEMLAELNKITYLAVSLWVVLSRSCRINLALNIRQNSRVKQGCCHETLPALAEDVGS